MSAFNHHVVELSSLASSRLDDPAFLSALVVAAAGAIGMSAHGPPLAQRGPAGIAVGLLCRNGHIVLHTVPDDGFCLVDIVARAPADVGKGINVIVRRLAQP
jgi:S-adenosylmethionine/arginine decarboxylase-like enzyme